MSKKDKYGFETTSLTLVERLAHGGSKEDWEKFWERYEDPVRNKFNAINRKGGMRQIDEHDVEDAIFVIFDRLRTGIEESYRHERGRLRDWLSVLVRNAIFDYRKQREKDQSPLRLDGEDSIEKIPDKAIDADKEWIEFLQLASVKFAITNRPWSARDKRIIKEIKEELMKEKSERRSDADIASQHKITKANLRQIRSRFIKEVRKQYDAFKNDDPAFFKEMERHCISFDALLDEYLKMEGDDREIAERRAAFKDRHLL